MASARTLTQLELNRTMLARQGLLRRHDAPLPTVLERIGGIQAQYAPSMYIGLWSRMEGLERAALTRALESRSVIQATLMRSTIHLVSAADYWPLTAGVREPRRAGFLRVARDLPSAQEHAAAADKLAAALAAGPMRRTEIVELIGRDYLVGIGLWVDMVRVPPSGTWDRRRADLFGLAAIWVTPTEVTEEQGAGLLVRRYLQGFGPSTATEIADWAGVPAATVRSTLDTLTLRRFQAEDGAELVDLPRLPIVDAGTPAPVRFLPTWDATLLAHARRTQILPEEFRPRIFSTTMPQSVPTFLVDGAVAGTWRYEGGGVRLQPFVALPPVVRLELEAEAARLAAFHA